MDEHEDESRGEDLADEATEMFVEVTTAGMSNLAAITFGHLVAGSDGVLVGAVAGPMLAQTVAFLRERVAPIRQKSANRLLEQVAAESGMRIEEFFATVQNDPPRLLLLANAIEAASRTLLESKIDVLAATVATGALATDSAVVEAECLVEAALADLEQPHIAVIETMAGRSFGVHSRLWTTQDLGDRLPGYQVVLTNLLSTLARHGLISSEQPDSIAAIKRQQALDNATRGGGSDGLDASPGPSAWRMTDFGRHVWRLLQGKVGEGPTKAEGGCREGAGS